MAGRAHRRGLIWRYLAVEGFDGSTALLVTSTPEEARVVARSLAVPEGSFTSRSYRGCCAVVAVGSTPLGVDLEVVDERVRPDAVLTAGERGLPGGPAEWCSWWSAKEALAKALGDARLYDPRRLASPALWEAGAPRHWRAQPLPLPSGIADGQLVGWIVWEEAGASRRARRRHRDH